MAKKKSIQDVIDCIKEDLDLLEEKVSDLENQKIEDQEDEDDDFGFEDEDEDEE